MEFGPASAGPTSPKGRGNVNKIIGGKRYDTDKAERIGETVDGSPDDARYYRETLYRKRTGEYFVHAEGGPYSRCARPLDPSWTDWAGGEVIRVVGYEGAREWAERNMDAERYMALFGDPDEEEPAKVATMLSIDSQLRTKLDREASITGKTRSRIVEELIEAM